MSLHGEGPTRKIGDGVPKHKNIKWDMEISEWEARRTLQQRFYQFQKVSLTVKCQLDEMFDENNVLISSH